MSEYITTKCFQCSGTGNGFDITNLDSASGTVDPSGVVECSPCSGSGTVQRLPEPAVLVREREAIRASQADQEIGEMPAWMC